jgi:hypothetical protein
MSTGKRGPEDIGPMADLAKLRDVAPPPSLVAGVMRRIEEPRPPSLWRWLQRPFVIRVRVTPMSAGAAGARVGGHARRAPCRRRERACGRG